MKTLPKLFNSEYTTTVVEAWKTLKDTYMKEYPETLIIAVDDINIQEDSKDGGTVFGFGFKEATKFLRDLGLHDGYELAEDGEIKTEDGETEPKNAEVAKAACALYECLVHFPLVIAKYEKFGKADVIERISENIEFAPNKGENLLTKLLKAFDYDVYADEDRICKDLSVLLLHFNISF